MKIKKNNENTYVNQQDSEGIWSLYKATFHDSSIPTVLFNISKLKEKCNELKRAELIDIDKYISSELFLKNNGFSEVKVNLINKATVDIFGVNNEDKFFINI